MPRARFSLRLDEPRISFDGSGYHDVNAGDGRLERAFKSWSWARFHDDERALIGYATRHHDGTSRGLIAEAGAANRCVEATLADGPARDVGWGLSLPSRFTLAAAGRALACTPDDAWDVAPFYARYGATLDDGTRTVRGMGEHLDLERFNARGIQFLLRFKTRRSRA